jgi:hypothetical protein
MQMKLLELVAGVATAAALVLMLASEGCGGGQQEVESPGGAAAEAEQDSGGELIPEEKYEEINATFDRKTGSVSRCYGEGDQSGDPDRKGHVTVRLTINKDGRTSEVGVMETSFKSAKVGECVVRLVKGWTFPTLPRPLETSHTYVLDRL